jgi:lipoprotein-anchoring transpeptidase ErfK/SrfK
VFCALATAAVAQSESLSVAVAGNLDTGEFVWRPDLAPSGTMSVVVNLRTQRAFVYRDNTLIGISTISSGRRGHETPTGTFDILEKERFHRSNRYSHAPMPFMLRLTWYGLAMHAGHVADHPVSHGCVRMPHSFAQALFKEIPVGAQVTITDQEPSEQTSQAS